MIKAKIIITGFDDSETVVEFTVECLEIILGDNLEEITLKQCKVVK
jgi:hypothetical protein